ncbi:MAG: FAD-linked oxidase C-terminal domain-containing protein [Nocardioides sp.]
MLEVARETGVPLTMRGAGTSIAGNAVGPGLVVDCSRHLTAVRSIDPEARTAVVEPGVVQASLQRAAAPYGLRFGPDPSSHTRCTIGGMVGNNACGSRALGYGRTADNVDALTVALGTGEVARLAAGDRGTAGAALTELVAGRLGHVRARFGRFSRQVSGYALEQLLPEHGGRVDRFLVGSEGTLGLVLDATVRLVEDPPARELVLLGYPSMADAADAVPAILALREQGVRLVACEGLDARLVELVRARRAVPDLPAGAGWLFVEVAGAAAAEAAAAGSRVASVAGALGHRSVTDPAEAAALWRIREDGAGLAARSLPTPAHAGWEDAAVPPERLGEWLRRFEELLAAYGLATVPYGHFGDGCLHARIDFSFDEAGRRRFREFLVESAGALVSLGGSLSGEHGDGRARSELLPLMYDETSLALFASAKAICDPDGVLNPGVLVDPAPVDADLRPARPATPGRATLRLTQDAGSLAAAVHRCTGVGTCVATTRAGVMCPSYLATREEKDSTRGRARVLQEALDGSLVRGLADPAVAEALELCLACKACATECPTGVDMAAYKAEVLHRTYAGRRRPRTHLTLGRLPAWLDLLPGPARRLAPLLRRRGPGRLAAWAAGVDPRRSSLCPNPPAPGVRHTNRADGSTVRMTSRTSGCGRTRSPTTSGSARAGRAAAADGRGAARGGHPRAGVLRAHLHQHRAAGAGASLGRGGGGRAGAVRRRQGLGGRAGAVVPGRPARRRRAADGRPAGRAGRRRAADAGRGADRPGMDAPDLTGLTVVAQPHCHHASVLGWDADRALLAASGATVVEVPGCCGLAGDFGMTHYDVSVAVAETRLLPALREHPDAVVLADGLSCRHQVADLAGRPALHLAELFAGGRRAPTAQ